MELVIRFPNVGGLPERIVAGLPRNLDDEIANLSEVVSQIEITQKGRQVPHITVQIRHWINALEDRVLEVRTALVMWEAYTELLVNSSPGDLNSKIILDQARNYFAHDCSVRLATINEYLAQLISTSLFLGFPEQQRQLPEKVMQQLSGTALGAKFRELYELDCCRMVREELRHAFVHRSSPIIPRTKWEEVQMDGEQVLYVASGRAAVRVSAALAACQEMYQALNTLGAECLKLLSPTIPRQVVEEAKKRGHKDLP